MWALQELRIENKFCPKSTSVTVQLPISKNAKNELKSTKIDGGLMVIGIGVQESLISSILLNYKH